MGSLIGEPVPTRSSRSPFDDESTIVTAPRDRVMATGESSVRSQTLQGRQPATAMVDFHSTDTPGRATRMVAAVQVNSPTMMTQQGVGPAMPIQPLRHRPTRLLSSRPPPEVMARAAVG